MVDIFHKSVFSVLGKENMWCTTGYQIFLLDKIKQHKENNEAIQCCHQKDEFNSVDSLENCSRW